ncbi:hypothetical protein A0H81_09979 [Grifola frondosa]|uniref:Uncharacterized protein n=1 Tax=Grifola frondosa TaxID=5627 RepID=A0A1C7LZ83_GRIFR|nr:hypothetical protein A0H81_09979 [Grifola frondosa]
MPRISAAQTYVAKRSEHRNVLKRLLPFLVDTAGVSQCLRSTVLRRPQFRHHIPNFVLRAVRKAIRNGHIELLLQV